MTEQQKDWWLKEHTDKIISEKDVDMEIGHMISMFTPSSGKSIDDRNKLVEVLQKMKIGELKPEDAKDQAREIFANREITAD